MVGEVPVPHTDGAGMMLPRIGKNRMVRLPWVKGLLVSFPFDEFIKEHDCSPIIKDIYGIEHDVLAEDIEIIFTKSQMKLWKYYSDWQEYKDNFKKYNCQACYTNVERDRIKDATINYQMLQTLIDITDDELRDIIGISNKRMSAISSSIDNMRMALGIDGYNNDPTSFQKSVCIYPELLNDSYVKQQLKQIQEGAVKRYKAGKLQVRGKYTFILPDMYAACEFWFLHDDKPKGLLQGDDVFCWLFRNNEELDCLRSPHLFFEHFVAKNKAFSEDPDRDDLRKWFCTDGLYTSTHSLISKVLQFDTDGDTALVVADKTIINVAKRTKKKYDIVPLYYNMRKADPSIITNKVLYTGLVSAFTGGNIGLFSNSISKIWNSETFVSGTEEEKLKAIDLVKIQCMLNNFCID